MSVDYYGNRSLISHIEPSHLLGESFACADIQAIPVSVIVYDNTEVIMIECQRITQRGNFRMQEKLL